MSKVFDIIDKETKRQSETIELIASENFVSENILAVLGSCLTNKYTEGYPAISNDGTGKEGRYYGGCKYYDELENYCRDTWKKVFNTDYHVNVQPHSGSQANFVAYMSILNPGDTILSLSLANGGHLSHGAAVNFSGKLYDIVSYDVNEEGFIDYDELKRQVLKTWPALVLAGASAYSRTIDFQKINDILDECVPVLGFKPYFMVDMAHIAGLIAAGAHPSPFGIADIVTTTTHKSLRGPRGGLIFCKPELAKKVDSAVFPGSQGGALQNVIAAKAICAEEALTPEFKEYISNVVINCKFMADEFIKMGYKIVTGGTDNHLFLLDLRDTGVTGAQLQEACDENGITLNKNAIPNDPLPPVQTSGVRIGTAAMTTKGFAKEDFAKTAHKIDEIIRALQ